jgi:predicted negative regulator of RcsB-dependent stress response
MSSETTGSTRLFELLAWAEANKKALAIGFVAVVVLVAAVMAFRWKQHETEVEANTALLRLRTASDPERNITAATAAEFLKIRDAYPRTEAGERALLLAAGALFEEGKYAEAEKQFQTFVTEHADHPLIASAAFGVAASLEAQGKQDEALKAYENVSTRYSKTAAAEDAKLAMARIYEAKQQFEPALKIYNELTPAATPAAVNPRAMSRKAALLTKHPELAPPITPLPVSTNATSVMTNSPSSVTTNQVPAAAQEGAKATQPVAQPGSTAPPSADAVPATPAGPAAAPPGTSQPKDSKPQP